jgi:hypothetical protein
MGTESEWLEQAWVVMGTRLGRAKTEVLLKLLRNSDAAPRFRQLVQGELARREALEQ